MGKTKTENRTAIFENVPIPKAVALLCVPTIISSLVMVLYNLADTYFVGILNDPVQNAAVTLAGPVLLAFNAINNLFGVGCSSMMSRALGRRDFDTVRRTSAFDFTVQGFAACCSRWPVQPERFRCWHCWGRMRSRRRRRRII